MVPSSSASIWIVEENVFQKLQGSLVAAAVKSAGFRTQHLGLDQLLEGNTDYSSDSPLLIVHSVYFAHRMSDHLSLAERLGRDSIAAHQTFVGHLPALLCSELLAHYSSIDSIICGDPETIFPILADRLGRGADWRSIPGVASRGQDGKPGLIAPASKPLDQIMQPMQRVLSAFGGYGFATIEASRGCTHACTFCLPTHFYRRFRLPYRLRSIPNLVDEIQSCYEQGVRLFLFDDDQFLPSGNLRFLRISQFASELADRHLEIAFTMKCRADDVDVSLFRHLKQSGLIRVYVGIESGSQTALDAFAKAVNVQQNLAALAILNELGIVADFRSLLFHPLTTLAILSDELAFLGQALEHVPTLFNFREVEVYPGTSFYGHAGSSLNPALAPTDYEIPDARAELVRRCCLLVLGSAGPFADARDRVTQLWFQALLEERFHSEEKRDWGQGAIRLFVARANREMLSVFGEILRVAASDRMLLAGDLHERIAEWLLRMRRVADITDLQHPSLSAADGQAIGPGPVIHPG